MLIIRYGLTFGGPPCLCISGSVRATMPSQALPPGPPAPPSPPLPPEGIGRVPHIGGEEDTDPDKYAFNDINGELRHAQRQRQRKGVNTINITEFVKRILRTQALH